MVVVSRENLGTPSCTNGLLNGLGGVQACDPIGMPAEISIRPVPLNFPTDGR
jgi:hypothetical protein